MAREIRPICDFIFGSIWTGLPTDTVDIELTIRTVKGIYTYRKDHIVKSTVFSPCCRTIIPSPHCTKRFKCIKMKIDRHQHGTKDMLHPIFLPSPNPNIDIPWERPEPDGPTGGTGLI